MKPVVTSWKKPITIARHAYGDVYKASGVHASPAPVRRSWSFTDEDGAERAARPSMISTGPGVLQAMHNTDDSIAAFARSCFTYALDAAAGLSGSPPRTPSPRSTTRPSSDIFQKMYRRRSTEQGFEQAGIAVLLHPHRRRCGRRVIRSEGGYHLGLQELRRRRDERHGRHRVRHLWP